MASYNLRWVSLQRDREAAERAARARLSITPWSHHSSAWKNTLSLFTWEKYTPSIFFLKLLHFHSLVCLFVCVRVCASVHANVCIRLHVCAGEYVHVSVCTCIHTHMCVCMCVPECQCVHVSVCIYVHVSICTSVYVCACV